MSVPTRKAVRTKLQELLQTALLRLNIPTGAVYRALVDDFQGQSPTVGVYSGGTRRGGRTMAGSSVSYYFLIAAWVLFEDPQLAGTWTANDAEDALDNIEAAIAQCLLVDNRAVAGYWKHISYADRTQTMTDAFSGAEYRGEAVEIEVLVA